MLVGERLLTLTLWVSTARLVQGLQHGCQNAAVVASGVCKRSLLPSNYRIPQTYVLFFFIVSARSPSASIVNTVGSESTRWCNFQSTHV